MPELRERKPGQKKAEEPRRVEHEKPKTKPEQPVDLEPNIWVVAALFILFSTVLGTFFWYKVDNSTPQGPFASWINANFPSVEKALNRIPNPNPIPGAAAQDVPAGKLRLTEEELKAYDGSDSEKPIYLAINGTIYDVSASPAFYGPGGHYNHFVGKDATRAWITECWDTPDQFTWRLDDVHVMFLPKWMDEMLADAANGKFTDELAGVESMPKEMIQNMAKKSMERFGSVTDSEKEKRRIEDKEEAEAKVQETLAHWVKFFSSNAKYEAVGEVIRDETRPYPPKPCEAAMKKRGMKGGKLEAMMGSMGGLFGGGSGAGAGAGAAGGKSGDNYAGMPADVKAKIEEAKKKMQAQQKAKEEGQTVEEVELGDDEDLVRDEL